MYWILGCPLQMQSSQTIAALTCGSGFTSNLHCIAPGPSALLFRFAFSANPLNFLYTASMVVLLLPKDHVWLS